MFDRCFFGGLSVSAKNERVISYIEGHTHELELSQSHVFGLSLGRPAWLSVNSYSVRYYTKTRLTYFEGFIT